MKPLLKKLTYVALLLFSTSMLQAKEGQDQHRPSGISDQKWSSLKAILQEEFELIPANGVGPNLFGASISVSGNRVLIGATADEGIGYQTGSAYVFEFDGIIWTQSQKLIANDGEAYDKFGSSVSLYGDWALIGSPGLDPNLSSNGSAYVFRFDGAEWAQVTKFTAGNADRNDQFGKSVYLTENRAFIGAFRDDQNGFDAGAVYVFEYINETWEETQKLVASDGLAIDFFGHSISVSGDVALIGAQGVDDDGDFSGAAYVYNYDGVMWNEVQKLKAKDGARLDGFGYSVALSGSRALLGAIRGDGTEKNTGAAYIFEFIGNEWVQIQKLFASDAVQEDDFGRIVSLSNNRALIGSFGNISNSKQFGSAYVFELEGTNWNQIHKLATSDNEKFYSRALSLSGNHTLVGGFGKVYGYDLNSVGQTEPIIQVPVLTNLGLILLILILLFAVVLSKRA